MNAAQLHLFVDSANTKAHDQANKYPQHTLGHHDCPACNELRTMYSCSLSAELPFHEAAVLYMRLCQIDQVPGASHDARYVRNNTLISYQRNIDSLDLFFHETIVGKIHEGHFRSYQAARCAGAAPFIRYRRPQDAKDRIIGGKVIPAKGKTPCPVKPQQCNQELATLVRIMKQCSAWTKEMEQFWRRHKVQEEESEAERSLTPEEQCRWLEVARSKERWSIIFWYSIVAFHTTCSTNELRALRIGDINLHHQVISVPWPGVKCKGRHRQIEITDADCLWALEQLMLRAKDLGSIHPQHHLFPFFNPKTQEYVPERPMTVSGITRRWNEVREATVTPNNPDGLKWFRPYDTRHTGITRQAEDGIPIEVIKARAGHLGDRTTKRYTHISNAAQRRWLRPTIEYRPSQKPPQPQWYPPAQAPPSTLPPYPPPRPQTRTIMFCGQQMVLTG